MAFVPSSTALTPAEMSAFEALKAFALQLEISAPAFDGILVQYNKTEDVFKIVFPKEINSSRALDVFKQGLITAGIPAEFVRDDGKTLLIGSRSQHARVLRSLLELQGLSKVAVSKIATEMQNSYQKRGPSP